MAGMKPHHIHRLSAAGEVTVSPDGSRVAFTVTTVDPGPNDYRARVWVADAATGDSWPVSAGERRDGHPTWSPDGRMLAWTSKGADGRRSLWVAPVEGPGTASVCGRWADDVTEIKWAPDGRRLAVVVRDRDPLQYGTLGSPLEPSRMPPRRITTLYSRLNGESFVADRPTRAYVLGVEGAAAPRLLTAGPWPVSGLAWAPDGRTIAFASARHDGWDIDLCQDLWTVDVDPGPGADPEPRRLTGTDREYRLPAWSPDGSLLAYVVDPTPTSSPRHSLVGVLDTSTGKHRDLSAALDRNAGPYGHTRAPAWHGDRLVFGAEDGGALRLFSVPADGSAPPELWLGGDRQVVSWDLGAGGSVVAFAAADACHVPELHLAGIGADGRPGEERRLTDLTSALTSEAELVAPERFVATSADGSEVECWAMAPLDAGPGPHPTILNVHGGPFTQYGHVLFDEFQILAAAGYGVVYCNPRGSSGYSEAWGRAVRWPEAEEDPGSGWGGVDAEDVMACVEEAVRRFDWVDPDALGVQGGSYGGFMTSWLVGHTDRFKAAVSERAANDLLTLESDSDIAGGFSGYVGHTHVERPELYRRQSPVTYVRSMVTPMLIVHSEDDLRCPISQAEEMFVALRLLGRNPELIRFPAESHELSRSGSPSHRVARAEIILEWFDRHLRASAP